MKIIHTHPAALVVNQVEGEVGTFSGLAVQLGTVNDIGQMINPSARGDLIGITVPLLDSHNNEWSTSLGTLGAARLGVRSDEWVTVEGPFLRTATAQQARDDLAAQLAAEIKIEMSIGYTWRERRYAMDGELSPAELSAGARMVDDAIDVREVSVVMAGRYPETALTSVNCVHCGAPDEDQRHGPGVSRCATVGAVGMAMLTLTRQRQHLEGGRR